MTMLQDLAKEISVDLNDYAAGHEFTTWTEDQIIDYILDGLQVAFTFRKDLFLHPAVIELTAGSSIQKPCDCLNISRIYGISTKDGRVLYGLRKRKDSDKLQWYGKTCPVNPKNWKGRDYFIEANGDAFFIEPAPPVGQHTYALVECATIPTRDELINGADLPTELKAPVIQWALYRAKMVDSENNSTIFSVANAHKVTFFQLLQVQYQLKDSVEIDSAQNNQSNVKVAENG